MRRLAFLGVTAAFVAWPAAAGAHEEINPTSIVVGKPTFFRLRAANEEKADLVKVTVVAPSGAPFGATTREPAGWSVQKSADRITWVGGAVKPDTFEEWGFETDGADQAGTLEYAITLTFAAGRSEDVTVPVTARAAGSDTDPSAATAAAVRRAKSRASTALLLGWVALGVAVVALLLALLRPPASRPRPEQDW